MRLAVELYGTRIGMLMGAADSFDFVPSDEGIERFGITSRVLSVAVPLEPRPQANRRARRTNWFTELLPEGQHHDYMLQQGGLQAGDTLGFLGRFGRDVAGALQIWDVDDPTGTLSPDLNPLLEEEVYDLLVNPVSTPLGNAPGMGQSSLAGVQPKIVLVRIDQGWAQSLGGYPTTHILKPQLTGELSSMIFDEEYGARLIRSMQLADFATEIETFHGLATLVIERFDRFNGERLHQEDFNQALGASKNRKYQEIGGVVSLERVADVLKRHTAEDNLYRLARMVIVAVALGNLDMHTKNLALLHLENGEVELAPAYDVVPQTHFNTDGKLALAVNRRYRHSEIRRADLVSQFERWHLRRSSQLVDDTLEQLAAVVAEEQPLDGAFPDLHDQVTTHIENLQSGRTISGV